MEKNMEKIMDLITSEVTEAFVNAGYEEKYGMVSLSNRPDLCQYQCNGALAAAKQYKKAPIMIANEVVSFLEKSASFQEITAIMPGFINIKLSDAFLASYVNKMMQEDKFGCEEAKNPKTIVIDY